MTLSRDEKYLYIYAPLLRDHHFAGGIRGSLHVYSGVIDWKDYDLRGGKPTWPAVEGKPDKMRIPLEVKPSMLQFTATETGVGPFVSDNSSALIGKIILPWPKSFWSLRCDKIQTHFRPKKSKIATKIKDHCTGGRNAFIGSATCFRYDYAKPQFPPLPEWKQGNNIHFYLQPCTPHKMKEVNKDLQAAAAVFTNPKSFNLRFITKESPLTPRGKGNCTPPTGIDPEDERSLNEEEAVKFICPHVYRFSKSLDNMNPANCPNFYVGP